MFKHTCPLLFEMYLVVSVTRLGDLLDFGQVLKTNLPKSLTFLGNFCEGVKAIIFLLKSFLGNFYRHLANFFWSHCPPHTMPIYIMTHSHSLSLSLSFRYTTVNLFYSFTLRGDLVYKEVFVYQVDHFSPLDKS